MFVSKGRSRQDARFLGELRLLQDIDNLDLPFGFDPRLKIKKLFLGPPGRCRSASDVKSKHGLDHGTLPCLRIAAGQRRLSAATVSFDADASSKRTRHESRIGASPAVHAQERKKYQPTSNAYSGGRFAIGRWRRRAFKASCAVMPRSRAQMIAALRRFTPIFR